MRYRVDWAYYDVILGPSVLGCIQGLHSRATGRRHRTPTLELCGLRAHPGSVVHRFLYLQNSDRWSTRNTINEQVLQHWCMKDTGTAGSTFVSGARALHVS